MRCDDVTAAEPHDVEAFGSVRTVLPYEGVAQAVKLAARGQGSLVGSIVTHDEAIAREFVLGAAHAHGRILVLDRDDARRSTGHASPLPVLVHGGPGRAGGGGEELGGIRGVLHHIAVQASPDQLTAIGGRWVTGARRDDDAHPFRKSLAALRIGDSITAGPRAVTLEDIEHFAEFTGDTFYAHMDEEAAAANPLFGGRVAHGYLIVAWRPGYSSTPRPGRCSPLRRGQPALPHPGQAGGGADGHANRPSRSARAAALTTARFAGTPSWSTARASRERPTTS